VFLSATMLSRFRSTDIDENEKHFMFCRRYEYRCNNNNNYYYYHLRPQRFSIRFSFPPAGQTNTAIPTVFGGKKIDGSNTT